MKLYAISDLHLNYKENRTGLAELPAHSDDWLILAGDIGELDSHYYYAFSVLTALFDKIFWVPGNHDLWSSPSEKNGLEGEAKYRHLVALCREYGVITPEDPYVEWPGIDNCFIVPMFLLYDYSFRPENISKDDALQWARSSGILCKDEYYLRTTPYTSISDWCNVRYDYTLSCLKKLPKEASLVLVNHFPLNDSPLERLVNIPRFSIWCGTKRTQDWHTRFNIKRVVYGHLHIRATDQQDGIIFDEVSLGYPRHWTQSKGIEHYLREIL